MSRYLPIENFKHVYVNNVIYNNVDSLSTVIETPIVLLIYGM